MKIKYFFYLVDDCCDCLVSPNEFYDFISSLSGYKIKSIDTGLSVLHYYVIDRHIVAYIEERRHF